MLNESIASLRIWHLVTNRFAISGFSRIVSIPRLMSSRVFRQSNKYWLGVFFIIGLHIFLLSKLMFFPYPELFVYPYLTNHGLLPYKQIFDQHFPGLFFFPINFETLGLTNEYIARYWQYALVGITHILLFLSSRKVFGNSFKALMVNILYLFWQPFFQGWVLWINNLLTVFYLIAFLLIIDIPKNQQVKRIFLTGLILGIATIFKQVALILMILVGIYLLLKYRITKPIIGYCLGYLIPITSLVYYFFILGIFPEFWFWTIQFNLTTYVKLGGSVPDAFSIKRILFVLSPVWLAIFARANQTVWLILIFLLGSFLAGGNNFDFTYFQPTLPFVCLASILAFTAITQKKIGWLLVVLYLLVLMKWLIPFYQSHSRDYVFYFDSDTKKTAVMVKELTKPGEEIFVFGVTPLIYQMSETIPAGKVFVYQFPWFLYEASDNILKGLKESQPNIIVSDPTVQTKGQVISQFAPELYTYIYDHYQLKDRIGAIEILEKKDE